MPGKRNGIVTSVQLSIRDRDKLERLVDDRRYFTRSEVIREGIRRLYQDEYREEYAEGRVNADNSG